MLSEEENVNSSFEEDDDYNLPSLSERIKASLTLQSQNMSCQKEISSMKTKESKILKNEKKNSAPLNIKLDFSLTSESEDEESQFLSFPQRIQSTPQIKRPENDYQISESDSDDEIFSNLAERLNIMTPRTENKENGYLISESDSDDEMFSNLPEKLNMMTPRIENKENYDTAAGSDVAKKMNEFRTPLPVHKKASNKVLDSESDESFTNFVEILRTPMSVKNTPYKVLDSESDDSFSNFAKKMNEFRTPLPVHKKASNKVLDSESDESFTNFVEILRTPMSVKITPYKVLDSESDESFSNYVEKLRTPLSINRKIQNKVIESDSDDSFINSARKQSFQTPQSQRKGQNIDILPKITEIKPCLSTLVIKDTPNSRKTCISEIVFKELFPPESINERFLLKRELYVHKLYEFYNKKVFDLQLPSDMPLSFTGALKTTAGLCCCSIKDGNYTCQIKLSSSLIVSFDNLKETLLHEMCHAAVWIINKRHRERHGPLWQIWASRCNLILPFIECPKRCHNFEIPYSVWYQCSKCKWKKGKCKQVRKYHGAHCKKCKTPITVTYT